MRRARLLLCLWAALVLLLPAEAAPVARALELQASGSPVSTPLGEPVRHRLDGAPEGEPLAKLEQGPEQLLVVTPGKRAGNARIVLATDDQFAVWSLRVDGEPLAATPEQEELARLSCPDLQLSETHLSASVQGAPCLEALAPLTALRVASEVRLVWNEAGLRAQLQRLQAALLELPDARTLKLRFVGAELRPEGVLTDSASLDAVRLVLFDASVGPLRLDLSRLKLARPGPR